jgi:hypothetical protein
MFKQLIYDLKHSTDIRSAIRSLDNIMTWNVIRMFPTGLVKGVSDSESKMIIEEVLDDLEVEITERCQQKAKVLRGEKCRK